MLNNQMLPISCTHVSFGALAYFVAHEVRARRWDHSPSTVLKGLSSRGVACLSSCMTLVFAVHLGGWEGFHVRA